MPFLFRALLTLIACFLTLPTWAQDVKLRSGECYEIRSIEFPDGAVVPAAADSLALTHSTIFLKGTSLWRITQLSNGYYTIQHAPTGRYMTHDGKRTTTRRYMLLTDKMMGMASQWNIYPGSSYIIIANVYSQYLLNVRRDSHIVGLYHNTTTTATGNERFMLYDKKGQRVSNINGKTVIFKTGKPSTGVSIGKRDFCINGKNPAYDARKGRFLFSLSEKTMGKSVELQFTCTAFPTAQLFVDGKATTKKGSISLGKVSGARTYRLQIVTDGDTVAHAELQFTYLPIVEIQSSAFSKHQWGQGQLIVHDATLATDSSYAIQVRNRGDWTARFEKRSMGIKLKDAAGKKINRKLLGLRTDNYWVLDAMTIDRARMRGRVAMDLWQDFSAAAHFGNSAKNAHHASRGRLVEVFLNGKYQGVYNLCERIDRQQLQLAKSSNESTRGVLYKADAWTTATLFGNSSETWKKSLGKPYHKNKHWEGWQAQYPEPSSRRRAHWEPLYKAIQWVCDADKKEFCTNADSYFDLPSVRDYYLFIELLFATDNSGKNMYWAIQDYPRNPQLTPIPWDLDGTFGRDWNSSSWNCDAHRDYRKYLRENGHQNGLFEKLQQYNPHGWNEQVAERYRQLRHTYFAPQHLCERFEKYLHLLQQSGADHREEERWKKVGAQPLHLQQEVKSICHWIKQRIATLDKQYQQ